MSSIAIASKRDCCCNKSAVFLLQCSKTCGKDGYQVRTPYCVYSRSAVKVATDNCPNETKPVSRRRCNAYPCSECKYFFNGRRPRWRQWRRVGVRIVEVLYYEQNNGGAIFIFVKFWCHKTMILASPLYRACGVWLDFREKHRIHSHHSHHSHRIQPQFCLTSILIFQKYLTLTPIAHPHPYS